MTPNISSAKFNQDDIARLAYLNWQKDGSPQGRDMAYWLEAETQIKATWHLVSAAPASETKPEASRQKKSTAGATASKLNTLVAQKLARSRN